MRVDDFRFYGLVCLIFGIILLVVGIVLPIATIDRYYLFLNNPYVNVPINAIIPYLNQGIALSLIGVVTIIISQILYREWRFRIAETRNRHARYREVQIPRIRHGSKQTFDTLVNEEAYLLARFLRNERQTWNPRLIRI